MYMCDNRFHTETLAAMLDVNPTFAFVIIDGQDALLATLV
jgi:peptide subunit release factor 1 (eRF1)